MDVRVKTRSVPREDWPHILARREAGEAYAAIARDYGVTGPAIRYIVDKAKALTRTEEASEMAAATYSQGSGEGDHLPEETEQRPEAKPAGGHFHAAAANRLVEVARACAVVIDKAASEGISRQTEDQIKMALHDVRRALAAVEIALTKGTLNRSEETADVASLSTRARQTVGNEDEKPSPSARANGQTDVVEGTVKFFRKDRGFGFVLPKGGGKDIYVTAKVLDRSGIEELHSGDDVWVSVVAGTKGPEAQEIGWSKP